MGTTQGSDNLFWELFNYRDSEKRWVLVTPPGIADNGGLIASASGADDELVGFGTTRLLAFSPLAATSDDGSSWSPGGLGEGLVNLPGALAAGAGSSGAALVEHGGLDQVLRRSGSLTSWSSIATTKSLAKLAPTCRAISPNAVDVPSPSAVLVGAGCGDAGVFPLFIWSTGSWSLVKVAASSAWAHESTQVLRLENGQATGGAVAEGLVAGEDGSSRAIAAIWAGSAGSPWPASPSLAIASGSAVVASGAGPGLTQFVVIRSHDSLVADEIAGPGKQWQPSAQLPARSATIAIEPNGTLDALSVSDSTLTVWHAARVGASFSKAQTIHVPIQYGSSS
jgi:hypothetical protein